MHELFILNVSIFLIFWRTNRWKKLFIKINTELDWSGGWWRRGGGVGPGPRPPLQLPGPRPPPPHHQCPCPHIGAQKEDSEGPQIAGR